MGVIVKKYILKNAFPVIWEMAFVVSCFFVAKRYFIYTNFVFYLGILLYFHLRREISFRKWSDNLHAGGKFWKAVGLTLLGFIGAFGIVAAAESLFPDIPTGSIGLVRDTWGTLLLFAVSTIILPPLCEEMFYRSSLIVTEGGKAALIVTTLLSMFLYALEHALAPFGILTAMLLAVPMSVAYYKTKNVYVVMTAHFIANLLGNGIDAIWTAVSWLS